MLNELTKSTKNMYICAIVFMVLTVLVGIVSFLDAPPEPAVTPAPVSSPEPTREPSPF